MRKALLIFALLVGMFLTIGCTDYGAEEDELEDDEELDVEDEDLGVEESLETEGSANDEAIQETGETFN